MRLAANRLPLPAVAREDWEAELPPRFEAVGAPVTNAALRLLLDASSGHPFCTMLLALESARVGVDIGETSETAVRTGLLIAVANEAWSLRDG